MEKRDSDIVLIEQYFDLRLSDEEIIEFEKKILEDPSFVTKVETYQESKNIVDQTYKNLDQEKRTQKWRTLIAKEKQFSNTLQWKWIGSIAAGFLVLISGWYFFTTSQQIDFDVLAQQAWDKKVGFDYYTVRDNHSDSSKETVINAYKNYEKEKYGVAIALLKDYRTTTLYYEDALLIRALSTYKIGHSEDALKTLDTLANYPTGKMAKEALWYQGLIYLDKNDLQSARKFLKLPRDSTTEIQLKE